MAVSKQLSLLDSGQQGIDWIVYTKGKGSGIMLHWLRYMVPTVTASCRADFQERRPPYQCFTSPPVLVILVFRI